jgi:PST family polysaccharide transporter
MFDKLKRNIVLQNIGALGLYQLSQYLFSFITFPYIVRVLGPEKFGLVSFALSLSFYFNMLVDYGFNFSAPRDISINRNNVSELRKIFWSVISIKFFLMLIGFAVLLAVINFFGAFQTNKIIFLTAFGFVAGNVLFPIWFFTGIERTKYIAVINILFRTIITICIFIFIKTSSDFSLYLALISGGAVLIGIAAFLYAIIKFKLFFLKPEIKEITGQLKNGFGLFISNISISFYTNSTVFILGLIATKEIVGYYSAAEKIITASIAIFFPISQALYANISFRVSQSANDALIFLKKIMKYMAVFGLFLSLILLIFAGQISELILGSGYPETINLIRVLSFLPFILSMSIVFANLFLLAFGHTKLWNKLIFSTLIFYIAGAVFFLNLMSNVLLASGINLLLTEMFLMMLAFVAYKKLSKEL